jgi:hypothetical protein
MYTKQELNDMILDLRTNLLDMKDKIEGMDETLDELVAIRNKLDESKEVKKRREAKNKGRYYYIDSMGDIGHVLDIRDKYDDYRYGIGNYFKTEKEAELYTQKQLIRQELEDLAMELSEEPVDWNDLDQFKQSIHYNHRQNTFRNFYDHNKKELGQIYCVNDDVNFLEIALERIGEEKLKILFGVEE